MSKSRHKRLFLIILALVIVPMVCNATCDSTGGDDDPLPTPPTTEEIVDEMVEAGEEALECFWPFKLFGFNQCIQDARYRTD